MINSLAAKDLFRFIAGACLYGAMRHSGMPERKLLNAGDTFYRPSIIMNFSNNIIEK